MNWKYLRRFPGLDTRARFVAGTPPGGSLLDLGCSSGSTLYHYGELRPDLKFFAVDIDDVLEKRPPNCEFRRGDVEHDPLPWPDACMDAITCTHVIEHLHDLTLLIRESGRLLKPGGRIYFEAPHPKSLTLSSAPGTHVGKFCINFLDASCHVRMVPMGLLSEYVREAGLEVIDSGISRNWLIAAAYPFYFFRRPSHKKFTSYLHWLGWSAYLIAGPKP
jgi:SAM-dependent methyltransferase